MKVRFRQGVIRPYYIELTPGDPSIPTYLNKVGNDVAIRASYKDPIIVNFCSRTKNYLYQEFDDKIAWKNIQGLGPHWLFWEIDDEGRIRYGSTKLQPLVGNSFPENPVTDQHFFSVSLRAMFVWTSGRKWEEKVRVFATKYENQEFPKIPAAFSENRSQVGLNQEVSAGYLVFGESDAVIKDGNSFVTTEDKLLAQGDFFNRNKIATHRVDGLAIQNIARYECVTWNGPERKISRASSLDVNNPAIGVMVEGVSRHQVRQFITKGYIHDPVNFNWNEPPNTYLFLGVDGSLTTKPPLRASIQRVGYIVDRRTIYIDIGRQVLIDPIIIPEPVPICVSIRCPIEYCVDITCAVPDTSGQKMVTFGRSDDRFSNSLAVGNGSKSQAILGTSPFTDNIESTEIEFLEGGVLPFPLVNQIIPQDVIVDRDVFSGPWEWISDGWWTVWGIGGEERGMYAWGVSWYFMKGAGVGNASASWQHPIKLFEGKDYENGWEMVETGGFMAFCAGIRDGKLYTWSHPGNFYWPSQLGVGLDLTAIDVREPIQVGVGDGLEEGWTYLSVNEFSSIAIRNGEAYLWGDQFYSGFSNNWVDVETIVTDNSVNPRLNTVIAKPSKVPFKDDWVFVNMGHDSQRLAFIDSQGRLYAQTVDGGIQGWSENDFLLAGFPVPDFDNGWGWGYEFYQPIDAGGILQVGVGTDYEFGWEMVDTDYYNALGIREGKLYYWGWGGPTSGLGEDNNWEPVLTPTQIGTHDDWTWVSLDWGSAGNAYAIRDGKLYVWGQYPLISNIREDEVWEPTIPEDSGEGWVKVWHGWDYGSNNVSSGIRNVEIVPLPTKDAPSSTNSYAYGWKQPSRNFSNSIFGMYEPLLGTNGSKMPLPTPQLIKRTYDAKYKFTENEEFSDWQKISTSPLHSLAIRNGKLYVWGEAELGQNGLFGYLVWDGNNYGTTLTSTALPTLVNIIDEELIEGWQDVSCGSLHSLGINSGKLYGWGFNVNGRIGINEDEGVPAGTPQNSFIGNIIVSPTQVGVDTDYENGWTRIFTSRTTTNIFDGIPLSTIAGETNFGIREGKLYSWGNNESGMTGLNDSQITFVEFPTQVGEDTNWQDIAVGKRNVLGLESGRLFVWGDNSSNQLGIDDENITEVLTPTQITEFDDWVKISASDSHMMALRSNGELYTWGVNIYGISDIEAPQVNIISTPKKEEMHSDWTEIYAGITWNIAKRDGKLFAWGLFPRDSRLIENQESPLLTEFTELKEHDWKDFVSVSTNDSTFWSESFINFALKESKRDTSEDEV